LRDTKEDRDDILELTSLAVVLAAKVEQELRW